MSKKKASYCCECYPVNTSNENNSSGCGILEAIIFWLIACGAGLLNTNSILIILLFLLYGWSSSGNCGLDGFGW